jgi:hypothetical protein
MSLDLTSKNKTCRIQYLLILGISNVNCLGYHYVNKPQHGYAMCSLHVRPTEINDYL